MLTHEKRIQMIGVDNKQYPKRVGTNHKNDFLKKITKMNNQVAIFVKLILYACVAYLWWI